MSHAEDPVRLSERAAGAPEEVRELIDAARKDLPTEAELGRVAAAVLPLGTVTATSSLAAKVVAALVIGGAVVGGGAWLAVSRTETRPEPAAAARVAEPRRAEPRLAPSVAPSEAHAPATTPSAVGPRPAVPSEASLLQAAQAALRSDPARALALVREHERRFPSGALSQERDVIAVEALSRLGRDGEARSRADEFRTRYPGSAHQRKVGSALSGR